MDLSEYQSQIDTSNHSMDRNKPCAACGDIDGCHVPARLARKDFYNNLSFSEFQKSNALRCNTVFHPLDSWTPQDWALAIAGEAGELCNILKKVTRGDFTMDQAREDILSEVADVITYCDLLMTRMGAHTAETVMKKYLSVSARRNYDPGYGEL